MSLVITILAVDPGRSKCGVAVVRGNSKTSEVIHHSVVTKDILKENLRDLMIIHSPDLIVVGGSTGSKFAADQLSTARCPVEIVDEKFTTLKARERFFQENPPRGIMRLVPVSLLHPKMPYDDWAAVILAERRLEKISGDSETATD